MGKAKISLVIVFIFSAVSVSNAVNVFYVDVNGPNVPGTGTFDDPFRRIQDAIDVVEDGNVIEIQVGLYTGEGNYDLDPNGKSITIRSINPNDPDIVAYTIIDPNGAGRGFLFQNYEDANCIISGLTIRNGYAAGNSGGAIFCYESEPVVSDCIITGNVADLYGGAVFSYYSSPTITGCTIRGNSAQDGGGLECQAGDPEISNCIITNNSASGFGGGVDCYYQGNPVLTNCTVAKNSADSGGGLCCTDSNATVENSILWANQAARGVQIALEEHFAGAAIVSVSYSDVEAGKAAVYDPCNTLIWAGGNIETDPCFASFEPDGNPNSWDFHLQSVYGRWEPNDQSWVTDSNTSLCVDAGDPNSNWNGEPWPNGKRINMGAYGGKSQASMNGNAADFDVDGTVNFIDFGQLASQWMNEQQCIEDLTDDGVVNLADLSIFVDNWLWQRN